MELEERPDDSYYEIVSPEEELADLQERESEIFQEIADIDRASAVRKQPFLDELKELRACMVQKTHEIHDDPEPQKQAKPAGPAYLDWVGSMIFHNLCSVIIAMNLILMGLELGCSACPNHDFYKELDTCFLAFYVSELSLHLLYHQSSFLIGPLARVWWNWLDLAIVASGLVEQFIIPLLGGGIQFNASSLRALRLLRVFRIARAAKALKHTWNSNLSWAEGHAFEMFMMGVIVLNSIALWLELDYPVPAWAWLENIFLALYSFELFVRLHSNGLRYFYGQDWAWNNLDFVIVALGMLEQWMVPLFHLISGLMSEGGVKELSHPAAIQHGHNAAELLRILRVARVLRLGRLLRNIKPLHRLLSGVVEAMQSMLWVMLLTFMLLYAASIVFTTLVGKGFIYEDYDAPESAKILYGSVFRTFLSLFKLMNDDQSMVEPIIGTVGGQLLFYGFMCMSNWMMLAILTSVVSDNMMSASRKISTEDTRLEEDLNRESVKRRVMAVFKGLDTDNNGSLDKDEFYKMIQDDSLRSDLCDASGLEAEDLLDMFKCVSFLDKNGKRVLPYATFITCLNDAHKVCSQRSALHIMERLRAMEHRSEARLNKGLVKLGVPEQELNELPSIDKNMREAQLEDQEEQDTVEMLKVKTSRGISRGPGSPLKRSMTKSERITMVKSVPSFGSGSSQPADTPRQGPANTTSHK